MQVVVRIRPLNARELGMSDAEVVTVSEEDVQNILVGLRACTLAHMAHTRAHSRSASVKRQSWEPSTVLVARHIIEVLW